MRLWGPRGDGVPAQRPPTCPFLTDPPYLPAEQAFPLEPAAGLLIPAENQPLAPSHPAGVTQPVTTNSAGAPGAAPGRGGASIASITPLMLGLSFSGLAARLKSNNPLCSAWN